MLFNSYLFIFIFLPLVLVGWYFLNNKRMYKSANLYLSCMSLWFYAYFNISYLIVITGSILLNYSLSFLLKKLTENRATNQTDRRILKMVFLICGVFANLAILFYFKYYDFFIENINYVFHQDFPLKHILLPLGISFFTFQQLSFIIDRCTDKAEHYSFLNYVMFVTFFPQLVAGPIVLYSELIPQFTNMEKRHFNAEAFSRGLYLFILGLSKKVLLADSFAMIANYGFSQIIFLDRISTIVSAMAFTFELYFDFSGYSDMAMGIGKMFNIDLPINFNSPFRSLNVKEFWQRWHITLSRFFLTYVYIPLGGNRKGRIRMLINTFIVFLLSGLWHGAVWTFVVWGICHGILVMWDNIGFIGIKGKEQKTPAKLCIPAWLSWILTFMLINLAFIFFRCESIKDALNMFCNLKINYTGKLLDLVSSLELPELYIIYKAFDMILPSMVSYVYLITAVLLFSLAIYLFFHKNARERAMSGTLSIKRAFIASFLLVWCIVSMSQVSTFLYFNF